MTAASTARLRWLRVVYALGLLLVGAHLLVLMLGQHEDWLVRSHQNRWAFRDVPSVRGALLDRHGRTLARDQPTFVLECVYERFRLQHPVGAAVHAATVLSRTAGSEVRYDYLGTALGPAAALQEVLQHPVAALSQAGLTKDERRELAHMVAAILAASCDRTKRDVLRALRRTAATAPATPLGCAVEGVTAADITARFAAILGRLHALERALQVRADVADEPATLDAEPAVADAAAVPADAPFPGTRTLLQRLDAFRIDHLEQRRTQRRAADGSVLEGDLLDRVARPIARELPFELAAALRVAATDQPGLRLEPGLLRTHPDDLPATLRQILGNVAALGQGKLAAEWVEARLESALGDELAEFLPEELALLPEQRHELLLQAQRAYERVLRARERHGTTGIEAMLDGELAGSPGMRLVERDARAKEQLLWSSLRVEPGQDLALSIDLDLQRLVEAEVAAAAAHWQTRSPAPARVDAAMAIVDAATGDVLALAGAPTLVDDKPRLPAALVWRGDGALGSIVKPFVLLEQLTAERTGQPHADRGALEPCAGTWRGPDRQTYRCDHQHWDEGKDPTAALAKSCNVFFFQLAVGLEAEGLRRALWRFGLLPPQEDPQDARFQQRPRELPALLCAAPRWSGQQALPMRGIGYGLEANVLQIANAYAALATGRLPTLGLTRGERRPLHPLLADEQDLAVVRSGLQECVERGTADDVPGLQEFGVLGKTGTAEIRKGVANNAWFAGYLPTVARGGVQLAFCAVVYHVPHGEHGADASGPLVANVLAAIARDAQLAQRYLQQEPR